MSFRVIITPAAEKELKRLEKNAQKRVVKIMIFSRCHLFAISSPHHHQLARLHKVAGLQAIQVDAAGNPPAVVIRRIPRRLMPARRLLPGNQLPHQPPGQIIHR